RIENEQGLHALGHINLSFDPSYQRLQVHQLRLLRDGTTLDRIDMKSTRMQREQGLAQNVYDGVQTEMFLLEDLRVGDVLEVAYSIVGQNPALRGHVSVVIPVVHPWPTIRWRYRQLTPQSTRVQVAHLGAVPEKRERTIGDEQERVWEVSDAQS